LITRRQSFSIFVSIDYKLVMKSERKLNQVCPSSPIRL